MRYAIPSVLVTLIFYSVSVQLQRTMQAAALWVHDKTGSLVATTAALAGISTVILLAGLFSGIMLQPASRLPIAFAIFVGGSLDIGVAAFLVGRTRPRLQAWLSTASALASTFLLALLTIWSGLAAI